MYICMYAVKMMKQKLTLAASLGGVGPAWDIRWMGYICKGVLILCCTTPSDILWHLPPYNMINPNWCCMMLEVVERHKINLSYFTNRHFGTVPM
jgi:hypothetical protein